MISIAFTPHRTALLEGHSNTVDVLVRAQAPAAAGQPNLRSPLNLALVLDRSGSMQGLPFAQAVRCAEMIIERLNSDDKLSLVVYGERAEVLVPAANVTDRVRFRLALRSVEAGGNTALHDGWQAGAGELARHCRPGTISRVLLLSDGCANVGVTDPAILARHCAELMEAGISTSTYGLGKRFNEDLMSQMAAQGGGQAHYGQSAEDLMEPFQSEFDMLSSLCARQPWLSLMPVEGVKFELLNDYRIDADGRIRLPDIAYGSEAWALVRLSIPRERTAKGDGPIKLLTAVLAYVDLDGAVHETEASHLFLPLLPEEAYGAITPDELVGSRAAEIRAAAIQEQARIAARAGDWERVAHLLSALKEEALHSSWLAASIAELERYARNRQGQLFSKEAHHKATRMNTRLTSIDESLSSWSTDEEVVKASFLRRKLEEGRRFVRPLKDSNE
ncbi:vWA domain-containing protein [Rhizobium sullae]|uniref:vWA domain-containing protein n=1 Tax=Rhizobium sullae TaxID=50338 RepID=UPI000B359CE5|nr:VWA domain-containing protein [Rhizobium sullae]